MKIAIDAMGGDNAPCEIVKGSFLASKELKDTEILLIGQKGIIERELKKYGANKSINIIQADEVIGNDEPPVKAVRSKRDSSIVKGLEMLRKNDIDAFISAGSTGAFMV